MKNSLAIRLPEKSFRSEKDMIDLVIGNLMDASKKITESRNQVIPAKFFTKHKKLMKALGKWKVSEVSEGVSQLSLDKDARVNFSDKFSSFTKIVCRLLDLKGIDISVDDGETMIAKSIKTQLSNPYTRFILDPWDRVNK